MNYIFTRLHVPARAASRPGNGEQEMYEYIPMDLDLTTALDPIWVIIPLLVTVMALSLVLGTLSGAFEKLKF